VVSAITANFYMIEETIKPAGKLIEIGRSNNTKKLEQNPEESDSGDDIDTIPFVCLVSNEDSMVTKCGHYFCMSCSVKRYKTTP
jgi:Zinc finger, C3HC4 type (RING finger)